MDDHTFGEGNNAIFDENQAIRNSGGWPCCRPWLSLQLKLVVESLSGWGGLACDPAGITDWDNGFQIDFQLTSNADTTMTNWDACWELSDGASISSRWSANVPGVNPNCATSAGWNDTIAPGGAVSFGIQGDKPGHEPLAVEVTACSADPQ